MSTEKSPGIGRFYCVAYAPETESFTLLARGENLWAYTWADAATRLFSGADPNYKITTMLIEYANLATPSSTIAPPATQRSDTIAYYLGLSADPVRDYVRVPLLYPPMPDQDPNYVGSQYLGNSQYNRLTFVAATAGNTGINGKAFTNAANSIITGCALVATPVPTDYTQDVLCFRGYFTTEQQILLPPSGTLLVPYQETFT